LSHFMSYIFVIFLLLFIKRRINTALVNRIMNYEQPCGYNGTRVGTFSARVMIGQLI